MTAYGELVTPKENFLEYLTVKTGSDQIKSLAGNHSELAYSAPGQFSLSLTDFYIRHDLRTGEENHCRIISSTGFIIIQFCVKGSCILSDEIGKTSLSLQSSAYNIFFIPPSETIIYTISGGTEAISIFLNQEFFLKHLPQDHIFRQKALSNKLVLGSGNNLLITAKMHTVLHDIIYSEFEGHLKKLYAQAKVIELLSLQLAQSESQLTKVLPLKQSDIDKMMLVKDLIHRNLTEPFSLNYLSRAAGTNEQYLKKHFKIVFGNTVFGYILSCKMEKAKEMLLSGGYRIADIAEYTGYKHATHFTSAFKKFFGYLPQQIKK